MTTVLIQVIHFIKSLGDSHSGRGESTPVYVFFDILGMNLLCLYMNFFLQHFQFTYKTLTFNEKFCALYVKCKTKRLWNEPKFCLTLLWSLYAYESANLNRWNRLVWKHFLSLSITFSVPSISHCFPGLGKACSMLLDCLKVCQSVLIRNIRFLLLVSLLLLSIKF